MGTLTFVKPPEPPERWGAPLPLAEAGTCALDEFRCGDKAIDGWLHRYALRGEGRHARTYVVLTEKSRRVAAYYCLVAGSVSVESWPTAKLRQNAPNPIPVLTMGRLGVDLGFQGRRLGGDLILHCMRQCLAASQIVGVRALTVQPINSRARELYQRFGFTNFRGEVPAMFLLIETIADAVASP